MARQNKHIQPKAVDTDKTFLCLKRGMAGPAVPPPTALFDEAVLFLNYCGSAPLLFVY